MTAPRGPDRADWRVLVGFAGLAAAAVLAGFLAPMIDVAGRSPLATGSARLVAIAVLLCAAGAILLAQRALAARRNRALLSRLAQGNVGEREVAFLGRRFSQSLAQLRRLRLSGPERGRFARALLPRLFVQELPWYVVIGAPGSGKTTALSNSGLQFPLAERPGREAVRGVGGTRNCDWWFASEAVLIDTAGRYTTQDSDQDADRTAWFGFLDLLRRHRPRHPLNGVLLCVSASDLLHAAPQQIAAHARELRERLDELRQRLELTLPVYLVVTKTDLLPGFTECFAGFDDGQRTQVWGATLPLGAAPARCGGELAALDARLHAHLLERLGHDGTEPTCRAALQAFPTQWRTLARTTLDLVQAVFGADGQEAAPLLRGVYFTSATQAANAPAHRPDAGRSFFVTRLLREVVFAESGLARSTRRGVPLRRLLERGLLGAAAIALLLSLGALWRAYEGQSRTVDAVAARLPALDEAVARAQRASELTALLPALDALSAGDDDIVNDDARLADHLLDRREMLSSAADDSYQRLLRGAFLSRIAARLEERLRRGDGQAASRTYETLRAYLMLFGGKHFDRTALRAYLADDWRLTLPDSVGTAERAALLRHLDRLLAGAEVGAPSRADAQLVAQARARVQGVPLAQRAATRLQQLDNTANGQRILLHAQGVLVRANGMALADIALPRAAPASSAGQRRERTQQVLAELAQEQAWVLGTARGTTPVPALADEVERMVGLERALSWQALLDEMQLAPTPNLGDSARLARALAQPDSPLRTLPREAARATAGGPADGWFGALRAHVDGGGGGAVPVAATQALLSRLAEQLAAADAAARRGAMPPPAGDVLRDLAQAAREAPAPLNRWLAQLHAAAATQWQAALRQPLAQEAARQLAPACASTLAQRYPFVRGAEREVSRDDFVRAFGAGGLFDAFTQRHLAPHGDVARGEAFAPLRRAQTVRDAYFRDGGRALGVRLEFRLLELDPGAAEFTLDVDGHVLRFRRDTKQAQNIDWLTLSGAGGRVQVQLTPSANSGGYVFRGPWALLRLLDHARVERGATSDRVQVVFDIEGRRARFEVRSASAHNPLLRQDLEQFQCPGRS